VLTEELRLRIVLLAGLVCLPGMAQKPDPAVELRSLCTQLQKTAEAEQQMLKTHRSAAVSMALGSAASLWSFVTDPRTPFLDRLLAANEGGPVIMPEQLPVVLQTAAEARSRNTGVHDSPCEYLPFHGMHRTIDWSTRSSTSIDYPVTREQRDHAPVPWQMQQVLPVLLRSMGSYYSSHPDRYPLLSEAAWKWHPHNFEEASVRSDVLLRGPRNAALVENIVRLALDDKFPDKAAGAAADLYVYGNDDSHFEELVHAAQIIILQRAKAERVVSEAAFWTRRLATDKYGSYGAGQLKNIRSATAILALSRWALDRHVNSWTRYISYAGEICSMVADPPYHPEQNMHGKENELAAALSDFEFWFAKQKERLEKEAAAEHDHWSAVAAELHFAIE
jgi:hypothetical protein